MQLISAFVCYCLILIKQEGMAWGNTKLRLLKHLEYPFIFPVLTWNITFITEGCAASVFDDINYLKHFNSSFPFKDRLLYFLLQKLLRAGLF